MDAAFALFWAIHATITALVMAAFWWPARKEVRLEIEDALMLLLPYATWAALFWNDCGGKDWGNLNFEPMLLGLATGLIFGRRVALTKRHDMKKASAWALIAAIIMAAAIWLLMPEMSGC